MEKASSVKQIFYPELAASDNTAELAGPLEAHVVHTAVTFDSARESPEVGLHVFEPVHALAGDGLALLAKVNGA
jgi:hypothetical protein